MDFNKYIKLLTNKLSIKEKENDEREELEIKYEDNMNMKQLINRKKKSNKRKRNFESKEDLEELAREQREMFEQARLDQMNSSLNIINESRNNNFEKNDNNNNNDIPQNIDELLNNQKEEINFD